MKYFIYGRQNVFLRSCVLAVTAYCWIANCTYSFAEQEIVIIQTPPPFVFEMDRRLQKLREMLEQGLDYPENLKKIIYENLWEDTNMTLRLEYAGLLNVKAQAEESPSVFDEAIRQYEIATTETPLNLRAWKSLAHAYVTRSHLFPETWVSDHEKAVEAIDKRLSLLPKDSPEEEEIARWRKMLLDNMQRKPVILRMDKLMSDLTEETPADYGLEMDKYDFNRKVYETRPLREEETARLAEYREKGGGPEAATTNKLEYIGNLLRTGKAAGQPELLEEAYSLLSNLTAQEPNNSDVLASLAYYYAIIRKYEKALELLKAAGAIAPQSWAVRYVEGEIIFMREMFRYKAQHELATPEFRKIAAVALHKIEAALNASGMDFVKEPIRWVVHTNADASVEKPE
ncbi:MAG: tetratricopeptide repeat protein [Verrucomicrobia bacterium]|nr:tetratricopeptide repeat protein [Verrucomicrobiota bacterium]